MRVHFLAALLATTLTMPACAQGGSGNAQGQKRQDEMQSPMLSEMAALQATAALESGRPAYTPATGVKFKASDNVFVKSALAVGKDHESSFLGTARDGPYDACLRARRQRKYTRTETAG